MPRPSAWKSTVTLGSLRAVGSGRAGSCGAQRRKRNRAVLPALFTVLLVCMLLASMGGRAGTAPNLLDFNGGAVLANPAIHNVYMDMSWDSHNPASINMASIDGFATSLVNSTYLNTAGQYGVGAASFTGSHQANILCLPPIIAGITDFVTISAWMQCMTNPSPIPFTGTIGGVPVPDNNTVYSVYVPSGTQINDGFAKSCSDYGAYHFFGSTLVWQLTILGPILVPQGFTYTVVPVDCGAGSGSQLDGVTYLATHEIIEAATDPIILKGWVDNNSASFIVDLLKHGEAADICFDKGASGVRLPNGPVVAPYWSNSDGACVPIGLPLLSGPPNAIQFGSQTVFTTSGSMNGVINNTGNATANVGSVSGVGDPAFSIVSDGCSFHAILPGGSCVLSIRFNPQSVGTKFGTFFAPYQRNGQPFAAEVNVTGTGVPASTSTALGSSSNPSVFGQSVTLTATVSSATTGTPTGTVTFKDCFGHPFCVYFPIGTSPVIGGVATLAFSAAAAVGNHSILALYSGDANFTPSFRFMTQTVNKDASITAVTSTKNPSVLGSAVTFTATVAAAPPGSGAPSGSVTFMNGGTPLGPAVPLVGGVAKLTTSSLSLGNHAINATYSGDGNFNSSSGGLTQAVEGGTTTSVTSSLNPSVFGEAVKFTATVHHVNPGTPTGTITFKNGGTPLGPGVPISGGVAALTTSALAAGTHSITAVYSGDTHFLPGTSPALSQTVKKASTKTTLTSSVNPSVSGQVVKFTVTVTALSPGSGTPTGTVTFKNGGIQLGSPQPLVGGKATLSTSGLTVGTHSITAAYSGNVDFLTSTSPAALSQTVHKAATTTTLTSSPNSSHLGQTVTFTATVVVVAPGSGTPTGTVTLKDGATPLGPGTLINGKVTFTTSLLALGSHSMTAVYGGGPNDLGSTSPVHTQKVNP